MLHYTVNQNMFRLITFTIHFILGRFIIFILCWICNPTQVKGNAATRSWITIMFFVTFLLGSGEKPCKYICRLESDFDNQSIKSNINMVFLVMQKLLLFHTASCWKQLLLPTRNFTYFFFWLPWLLLLHLWDVTNIARLFFHNKWQLTKFPYHKKNISELCEKWIK